MSADTVINNAFVVEFTDAPSELEDVRLLWGIVIRDNKGRFDAGHYVCTTQIMRRDGNHFYTGNTIYEVQGTPDEVKMLCADIVSLRAGYSPDEIQLMKHLRDKK